MKVNKKSDMEVINGIISDYGDQRITAYEALEAMTEYAHKLVMDLEFYEMTRAVEAVITNTKS